MGLDRRSNSDHATENKYAKSSNVDDGVLDNLSSIVSALADQGDSKDFRPLIVFFQKGFLSQAVQLWSYYAQVNNHPKFSKTTSLLVSVLRQLNGDPNALEYGSKMIDLILTGHVKVLYRGVNTMRASITNPILRLMKEFISFNSGQHVESFVANFDLSMPGLVRIIGVNKADVAIPKEGSNNASKSTMRDTFLDFWLELISRSSPILRKQVITTNSKIMGAWFKLMDKVNSPEMMSRTLDVFTNLLLREPSYKRTTKCQILNELALSKIHTFYYSPDRALVQKVNTFFLTYGSDPEFSVAFPDDAVWFLNSPISGSHRGVEISINQRRFKVYNKLLFNILRLFKPWEDDLQLNTVTKILDNVPELVAPYAAFLASLGAHDPKMTSYWFGCTTLLGRIIHLKIPSLMEQVETDLAPHTPLVMESILPASLSKSALTKSLQHEKLIIRQLACQLMVFAFQKLNLVLDLYDKKGWSSSKVSLRNAFHLSLPDLSIISSVMNQSYELHKENKILQLSLATILKYYSTVFPNFFSVKLPSSNIFIDIMQSSNFSGMDLAILESFLNFQELNGLQTKWWNRSNQEQSFFTSLLNVARGSSRSLSERICQLLDDMFRGTVAFNRNFICSPHRALIHSLVSITHAPETDVTKIWRILDESIQHVMRIPYKYVDISANHERISPFVIALLEQCKYASADNSDNLVMKWVSFYLRTMIICGESKEGIESAAKLYLPDLCLDYIERYLGGTSMSNESVEEKSFWEAIVQTSFLDLVVLERYPKLKGITRCPVSELDAAGLIFRIIASADDLAVKFDGYFKSTSTDLTTMLTNYAIIDQSFTLMNLHGLQSLLHNITKATNSDSVKSKYKYITRLILQTFNEARPGVPSLKSAVFEWLQEHGEILEEENADEENVRFLVTVLDFMGLDGSNKILQNKKQLSPISIQLLSQVLLAHPEPCIDFSIIVELLQEASTSSQHIVSQFLAQNRVKDLIVDDTLATILSDDRYSNVTKAFINSRYFSVDQVIPHLQSIKGQRNILMVASALQNFEEESVQEFVKKVLISALSSLKNDDASTSQLALDLIYQSSDSLSNDEKKQLIDFLTKEYKDKYCAAAVKCVVSMGDFEDKDVRKWLDKVVLYITKNFSAATVVDSRLMETLGELKKLDDTIWQKANKNILNSHHEAILSGSLVNQELVLEYVLRVLLAVDAESTWNERLMQCLINNESKKLRNEENANYITFLTASTLYVLFQGDPERNSNAAIQETLLSCYQGSVSPKDRLILKILELIEAQISLSWTNLIYDWELVDESENNLSQDEIDLITKRKEGLIITLNRRTIAKSAENYTFDKPKIPTLQRSKSNASWDCLMSFYHTIEQGQSLTATQHAYDPMFLLLLSVQNEELVKTSKAEDGNVEYKFDVKAFLSSNIFQVVLCALGDESEVRSIALSLVEGMLSTLQREDCPKEMRIFRILLSKIVYTFLESKAAGKGSLSPIAPCIWFAVSQLAMELSQPTSQLHEKAVWWVLSKPLLRPNDLPLYQELVQPRERGATDQSTFYKQLGWVLNTLQQGLKTEQDVEFVKRIGLLEWLSNLLNLPYINGRMRSAICAVFYTCQRLGNSGAALITRTASIATFELQKISLERKVETAELEVSKNSKNSRHLQKLLTLQQQSLNSIEVSSGNAILADSNKRLRDWTENDACNIEKRIKNSYEFETSTN